MVPSCFFVFSSIRSDFICFSLVFEKSPFYFFLIHLIIYFGCTRSSLQHVGSLVVACKLLVVACGI